MPHRWSASTYEPEPAARRFRRAKTQGEDAGEHSRASRRSIEIGDARSGCSAARRTGRRHVYRTPRHNHNAIELHARDRRLGRRRADRARRDADGARTPHGRSRRCSGIDEDKVHVISPFVGGGFGGKTACGSIRCWRAAASKLAGRPVRIVLSREGVFRIVGGRTITEQRVALGAQAGRTLDGADPHRHRRDDRRTTTARSSSPFRRAILYAAETFKLDRQKIARHRHASPTPSCARRASRSAPSRSSARSTSSPTR